MATNVAVSRGGAREGDILGASPVRTPAPEHLLTTNQLGVLVLLGVLFWFGAALLVRFGTAAGWTGGLVGVVTFLCTIPGSWPALWLVKKVAALQPSQVVPGLGVGTAVAACCDGVALTWAPALYGSESGQVVLAAAWILWGAGVLLALAYLDSQRRA